jgi:glycosyltransferase involved in cell wall biosynthesis
LIVFVNYPFESELSDPDELLDRYGTLTGFAGAVAAAASEPVTVVQRFGRDAERTVQDVRYRFVRDPIRSRRTFLNRSGPVAEVVAGLDPRIVHFHGLVYPLAVRQLRGRLPASAPLLVQDHGGVHPRSGGFRRWPWVAIHRFGLRAATGFLFTATEQAEPWRQAGIICADQPVHEIAEASSTIPSSSPGPRSDPAGEAARLPGRPALLWVGRLNENKDPLVVLAGFERALAGMPEAVLSMVFGTDDLIAQVMERIACAPALAKRVRLLGRVPHRDMPSIYQGADLLVLASHHESCGYAVVEALSFGVTPIVTEIPAFRVLTDDGRVGHLFPVGDAERLATAIVRAAASVTPESRRAIREHFDRHLSWPAVGRRCVEIYRRAEERWRADISPRSA